MYAVRLPDIQPSIPYFPISLPTPWLLLYTCFGMPTTPIPSATIPRNLGKLTALQQLHLSNNELTGKKMPCSFACEAETDAYEKEFNRLNRVWLDLFRKR